MSTLGRRQAEVLNKDTADYPSLCRESMRMMPVSADGTFRVSATDLKVGPHTIPAGKHGHRPKHG